MLQTNLFPSIEGFDMLSYVPRYHSLGSHCTSPGSEESFWVFCFLDHL